MLRAAMAWRQGQSYSEDLRARVLAAIDGGLAVRPAACVFRVSVSYIHKALIRRRWTGEVSASTRRGRRPRKLTPRAGSRRGGAHRGPSGYYPSNSGSPPVKPIARVAGSIKSMQFKEQILGPRLLARVMAARAARAGSAPLQQEERRPLLDYNRM